MFRPHRQDTRATAYFLVCCSRGGRWKVEVPRYERAGERDKGEAVKLSEDNQQGGRLEG